MSKGVRIDPLSYSGVKLGKKIPITIDSGHGSCGFTASDTSTRA